MVDEYFNDLKKTRLVIDNLNKPIKGVSTYKVVELKEICSKLQINIMKNANIISAPIMTNSITSFCCGPRVSQRPNASRR